MDALPGEFVVDAVVGPAFQAIEELSKAVAGVFLDSVGVHRHPPDLVEFMADATVAVSAAGSTCWGARLLGVPAVLLVAADNQAGIAAGLAAAGFAASLGPVAPFPAEALGAAVGALLADAGRRARMAAVGQLLVDGGGADRVAGEVLAA